MKSYYDVLGVPPNATIHEIEKAYREKARKMHPDAGGEHETFVELSQAYETLKDSQKRRIYDQTGSTDGSASIFEAALDTIKILATQLISTFGIEKILKSNDDLITILAKHVKAEMKKVHLNIENNKMKILLYGQAKSKVNSKSDRNVIHEVFDDCIKLCTQNISSDQRRVDICKACLEILKDYSYGLIRLSGFN